MPGEPRHIHIRKGEQLTKFWLEPDMKLAMSYDIPLPRRDGYPNAPSEWKWQYAFPAKTLSLDPESGVTRRHHVSEQILQRALRDAATVADVSKRVTVHTLRHSFATHLLM